MDILTSLWVGLIAAGTVYSLICTVYVTYKIFKFYFGKPESSSVSEKNRPSENP
jgi:hypothetical protein